MRILIASAHRNLVGGVEKYLQVTAPGLMKLGHQVALLYEYPSAPRWELIDPPGGWARSWCLADQEVSEVLRSIDAWKPEIVYSHGNTQSVAVENALLERYPVALYVHNYDRTCGTGRKCYSFPHIQTCTREIGPMCLILHYPRRCGGLNPLTMWNVFRRHSQLNERLNDHHAVLVASSSMHCEMQRHGIDPQKLHLAPLPTTDVIAPATPPAPKSMNGKILFVGRLTDIKGADYLLRAIPPAARELRRPLTITIAGDGPERPALEKIARENDLTVEFAGWVHTADKLKLMRDADLLAVPSLWPEPFGLVGIEAGCLGLPAVGYATGGIPDWLIAGETGELAPGDPPTVRGLSDAIVRALNSPQHYAKLCLGAWSLAKTFTLEKHLAQLEPLLAAGAAYSRLGLAPVTVGQS